MASGGLASEGSPTSGSGRIVLVTGATGFVGSHIAEALLRAGWSVRCTVRPTSDTRWLEHMRCERVTARVERAAEVDAAVTGAVAVVHAAGLTRARSPREYRRVNVEGTEHITEAAVRAGVRRLVLVSSLAARGPDAGAEETGSAAAPSSAYGRSKLDGERRVADRISGTGTEAVILRPGGVFGPRDTDLLPLFRMARYGWVPVPAGAGPVQPVFVTDVATAAARALEADAPGIGPYPVAGAEVVTWETVAEGLGHGVGRPVRAVRLPAVLFETAGAGAEAVARLLARTPAFDRRRARDLARLRWTCRIDATERALGWRPAVGLADGLARTGEWYRERGWLKR